MKSITFPEPLVRLFGLLLLFCSVITAHAQTCPQGVRERKEWRQLTGVEQQAFFAAVRKLMERPTLGGPSRWDKLSNIHLTWQLENHSFPPFLAWHRMLLVVIEKELQSVDPSVMLPYWDHNRDPKVWESPVFLAFGGDGTGAGNCVRSGPFAGAKVFFPKSNLCLSRRVPGWATQSALPAVIEREIRLAASYDSLRSRLEPQEHAPLNNIGGDAATMAAVNDPLAVLIMANTDRWWAEFQVMKEHLRNSYGGRLRSGQNARLTDVLNPWVKTAGQVMDPRAHCYTYSTY